jgi:exosortase A
MHAESQVAALATMPAQRQALAMVAIVAAVLAFVLAMHYPVTASMVTIWARSDTFAHGFIVVPIFLYLVWRDRFALAALPPRPFYPALAGVALAAAVVWLGTRLNAVTLPQLALMAMFCFALTAVAGTAIVRRLAFPLAFLFFAVPFGEFLVPTLIDRTADFTVLAIRASGVPIYREGNSFLIPSGRWSVVEACSGLRYLIASAMVGTLFAYLAYRSTRRRLLFIATAIAVPIVANWVRAYMIVMLGHLSNNRIAAGVDHLVYGWIFFGVVMLALFWVGSRWREDEPRKDRAAAVAAPWPDGVLTTRVALAAVATAVVVGVGAAMADSLDTDVPPAAARLEAVAGASGWRAGAPISNWRPDVSGAAAELNQGFESNGVRAGLYIAFYRDQTRRSKAITSLNQLVRPENPVWIKAESSTVRVDVNGRPLDVNAATVSGASGRLGLWQWYWIDGNVTSSDVVASLYQAIALVRGRSDAVAWVVLYTPTASGERSVRDTLRDFATAIEGSIDASLRSAASAQ